MIQIPALEKLVSTGIFGILLVTTGLFDCLKYSWQAKKIRALQSAKGHSRKFINAALINDLVRFLYFICVNRDIYLMLVTVMALYCMLDMFWAIYIHYPYKQRGLNNFKRPNIILYTINSFLPNRIRRRL